MINKQLYYYNAIVLRWVDGDTVDLSVDLGFSVWVKQRFRLSGIDTPERGKPGYIEATEFSKQLAPAGTYVKVLSNLQDKYGRYLADIYVNTTHVNQQLLDSKHAKPYMGGTK